MSQDEEKAAQDAAEKKRRVKLNVQQALSGVAGVTGVGYGQAIKIYVRSKDVETITRAVLANFDFEGLQHEYIVTGEITASSS